MKKPNVKTVFLTIIAFMLITTIGIFHAKYAADLGVLRAAELLKVSDSKPTYSNPSLNLETDALPVHAPTGGIPKAAVLKSIPIPQITAESYLIGDLNTGEVFVSKSPEAVVPIASISKLITLLTAEDMNSQGILRDDDLVTITEKMLEPIGTEGNLAVGEVYAAKELRYPLLLESSNDAADALAEASGYDHFITSMKIKANEIGMTHTSFEDPSGLSDQNISNAQDLFALARYLYKNEPKILELSRTPTADLASTTARMAHHYANTNPFVGDPHYIGGKTGRTAAAKESMLSLFNYEVGSKTYPIVVIVLRSDYNSRQIDSSLLFEQFFMKVEGAH
ncbi:MAG: D-alanyl-D-alanine carboxypeptidase [Candidatus Taylorbacteria bacterium]|nr:D-alanyl-D-alanine carboxypeptidase [Candidatus Taylorbacteria bacterium]